MLAPPSNVLSKKNFSGSKQEKNQENVFGEMGG